MQCYDQVLVNGFFANCFWPVANISVSLPALVHHLFSRHCLPAQSHVLEHAALQLSIVYRELLTGLPTSQCDSSVLLLAYFGFFFYKYT